MPLKKQDSKLTENPHPVAEGPIIRTINGSPMSLFSPAKMPMVTLHANQFEWPSTMLVVKADRVPVYEMNAETGWGAKNSSGDKIKTGEFQVRLQLVNGDIAQMMANSGQSFDGLSQIQCTLSSDIPVQKFVPNETLIKLVKPNVMLGFGGNNVDRIVLVAEGYEEV